MLRTYQNKSDADLWRMYHKGDSQALGHLYQRHFRKLYLICYKYAKNKEIAEGMMQDIFLKILEKGRSLAKIEIQSFEAWLKKFAYNHWLHQHRTQSNRRRILDTLLPFMSTSTQMKVHIDADHIRRCLEQIENELHRQILVLSAHGYANPEIAEIIGESVTTIRKSKYEAKKKFERILKREGVLSL